MTTSQFTPVHEQQIRKDIEDLQKWVAEMKKDPERVRRFLIDNGFITENGELTKEYGGK